MLRRTLRLLAILAIGSVALVVIALALLHTNPVQRRVLNWSVGELERRFDLDLVADDLHYNLLARRVTMANVRLAAVGHRDDPFFTAASVTVRLPWAAYVGRLRFDDVAIEAGSVAIVRDKAGVTNLPSGGAPRDPNAPPRRIDIRGLTIASLDFVYRDEARDIEIRTPGLRTGLEWITAEAHARGPLAIDGETLVRVGDRRVTMAPLTGTMTFDGSDVGLEQVTLDTSDGRFVMNGEVTRSLDRPTLDLSFEGITDLSVASRWTSPPVTLAGEATISAKMTGPPTSFVLDTIVAAANALVGDQPGVSIEADARLTPNALTVSRSTIRPPTGGEVHATVDLPFDDDAGWWVKANYSGVDAATAFRLGEVEPLPFGAALTGTAVIAGASGEPFRLEVHNRSVPVTRGGSAPLAGEVVFVIEGDRWRAEQSHRMGSTTVTGDLGGNWNRRAATQSTFDGVLHVDTGDVGEAARYAALFDLTTPQIVRDTAGPLTAQVRMGGVFNAPRFVGSLATEGIDVPSIGRTALTAEFDASERLVEATNINASIGSTTVQGSVRADLDTRALAGTLELQSPDAADLMTQVPEAARLRGPLSAVATLGGTVDTPDIVAEVSGRSLTLADQPVESLTATARVSGGAVNVERFVLQQPDGGALRGSGRYEWESRTYAVDLDGQDLVWRGALARLGDAEARFGLKFAGSGPLDEPSGEGAIEFAVSGGLAGELIDRGLVNVRLTDGLVRLTGHVPALGALVTATVTPSDPFDYDAVVVMNRIDLVPLAALGGVERGLVAGTASLSAYARGTLANARESRVFVNLQDLRAQSSGVPVTLTEPARVSWEGDALVVDRLDLAVGQGRLVASGRLGEGGLAEAKWESTFEGDLADLIAIARPFGVPPELAASGRLSAEWRSTGGLDETTARVRVDGGEITWAEIPPVRELVVDASFDGTTLTVAQLTGRWQEGGIEGTASIPRAVLEARPDTPVPAGQSGFAKLRVSGITEEALAPWLSDATRASVTGRLAATLDARITRPSLDGLAGTLVVDEADFTLAGVPVRQTRASIIELDGGLVSMRDVEIAAGDNPLTITGSLRFAPADKQTLSLAVQGTAALRIISAFTPALATDGLAKINIGLGGTLSSPVFSGRIDVAGAELALREPRIVVSELNGTMALDGQRIVFDSFNGTINGGRLILDGGFLFEGFQPAQGSLVAVIDGAAIEYPGGLQSEANAIVTLRPGPPAWSLTGEVSIVRSAYTAPISLAGLIAARGGVRTPDAGGERSWAEQLRLNLWVTTQQDLIVDNNYGRFEVGGAIRVIGTVSEPVLAGRLTLNEGGEVYLAGNTFRISRGSITFTNPFRIVPEFDIELRTLVSGSDLSLTLEGPLDRLRTDVRSSDPTVDSREAMAMLFGGLEGEDAISLLSAELLGATGRAIGLDALRVERSFSVDEFRADPGLIANETDPSTRLTLSKRLRPDVELILSQSLRESGALTAVVSYNPRSNIELRAVSRDGVERSVALRHEITFGGTGTGASARPTPPEVTAITFTGNLQRPEEELRAVLELNAGEPFDFYEWQRDIDRLRAAYHSRGQFEVRVRGTRSESEDGKTVALDYEIEPGPVTELEVEGHPLDAGLQDQIRTVWRRAIFDRFLLDEIRTLVTRHLLEENIVGSTVTTEVTVSTPERKVVRVTVDPGARISSRQIRYSGNLRFEDGRLDEVVAAAALTLDGWLDPPRVAQTVQDFYRSQGFLSAAVTAEPPVVAGDVALLSVIIDEGPQFVISSLEFPGVSPERRGTVQAAVELGPGTPLVTRFLDDARRRIEQLYGSLGYNTVQIEVTTDTNPEKGTADVTFAVLEGPQQVLREVVTTGATRTDDDVVRRALRLRIGAPVDLGAWSQARKRMYDTNVFRQVDIEPVPLEPTAEESAAGIQPVRAVVRVTEYPVWRLRYGTQFTDESVEPTEPGGDDHLQSLGVLADLQNQNLFGWAITAGVAGRYERNRQAGSLFTSNGTFFGLPIRSSAFLFGSRQRLKATAEQEFIDERIGLSAEQRWRPFFTSEVIWSYRFERSHTFDPDPAGELIPLDETVNVSSLNAAMFFDRRDDPTDPSRGWFAAGNWEQGIPAFGSDSNNGKFLLQQSIYRALGRLTLAGRAQFGSSYGSGRLLFSQRFMLGGGTTVRGYGEDALGPRDVIGPLGGDAMLAFNAEARFPLRGWVQGVAFVDAGNVFETRSDISFRDLAVGYGLGLRLASPFAMLRVDFGIPAKTITPDRPAGTFKSGRWYFGIGHIF